MLWIETGIAKPTSELLDSASKANAMLLHLPALAVEPLCPTFSTVAFEAAFFGSPRAAIFAAQRNLLNGFTGKVIAVGEGTAKALTKTGFATDICGDSSGAENLLQKLCANGNLPKTIAWISAEETAVNLNELAKHFDISIQHVPVYRTIAATFSAEQIAKIEHPCRWILRSGKGVLAVQKFFEKTDEFEAIGASAKKALELAPKI